MNRLNTNINQNQNTISALKTPRVLIPFMILLVFLIIVMFLIFFKVRLPSSIKMEPKSTAQIVGDTFIVVFFCLIIFVMCVALLPNLKEIKTLFEQINSVVYVIVYTIFLILFYTLSPSDFINKYAKIIVPFTVFLGILSFYKGLSQNYVAAFNINYERIKMLIISFCLITCYIIFYNTDPGGIIKKYFGYSSLFTILTLVFAFLYTVILLTLPDQSQSQRYGNVLSNFSKTSIIGSLLFFIFIILMTILIYYYPGGFLNDKVTSSAVIILLVLIISLWSIFLVSNLFPEITNKGLSINQTSLFKRSLLALFGIIMSGILIYWLTTSLQHLSGRSGTISFILNLILILIFLGLIYKAFNVQSPYGNSKKSGFFNMIMNLILFIPCIFASLFDRAGKTAVGEYNATTAGSIMMLCLAIGIYVLYFTAPIIVNKIATQGGKQLVNKPVYTNVLYNLGTYQDLNGSEEYDYSYAISCWIFIDAVPPNMSASYDNYTSLLNFADKPNILYNGSKNILMITTQQKDLQKNTENENLSFDKRGNRIVYKNNNLLLQKWNNIILNYNSGVLDVFLNGELVKSNISVVPYYTLDNLSIGENGGIEGGICNVVYFKKPLTVTNIYYMYNMLKNKNPPTTNESSETIMVKQ